MAQQPVTRTVLGALALVVTLSITACSQVGSISELGRQPAPAGTITADSGGGKLTVKEPDEQETASELTLAETQKLPDLELDAWLSDDVALVSAENKTLPKYDSYDGNMVYPRSIYTYDVNTQDLTLVLERSGTSLSVDAVAPGGNYITFWDYLVGDSSLYVLDLNTGETTSLGVETTSFWIDARTVVGYNFHGTGMFSYTVGDKEPVDIDSPKDLLTLLAASQDFFYYGDDENKLKRYDRATKQTEILDIGNVRLVELSPDETQLAVTLIAESGAEKLYVCDLECTDPQPVGEASGRAAWSPNMQMLAYTNSVGTAQGFFVKDFLYGNTTQILVGGEYFGIHWSPNGKRLGISAVEQDGMTMAGTIIATLSGPATQ